LAGNSQAPIIEWQKSLGGSETDFGRAILEQDGFLVASAANSTDGQVPFHEGGRRLWMKQLSNSGELMGSDLFGPLALSNVQVGLLDLPNDRSIIATTIPPFSEGYVCDTFSIHKIWMAELDQESAFNWEACLGGSGGDGFSSIRSLPDGGYIMLAWTSSFDGPAVGNHGLTDLMLLRLDATGAIIWSRCYGGSHFEGAGTIEILSDGGFLVAAGTR